MRKSSKGNLEGHYMITSNLGDTVLCWLLKCIRLFYTWDCTGVYETSSVQGQHQLFVFLKEDDKATTQNTVNACLSFTCYIEDETNLHCKAWLSDLKFLKENKKKKYTSEWHYVFSFIEHKPSTGIFLHSNILTQSKRNKVSKHFLQLVFKR